ncbi:hypothetical protein RJ639_021848 [Escallonia herrerae]|uniref:Uncharacterized protein n=1 Tax=Escallonia herrerae TaxID=1293975 RepID=A0AA88V630_9ASTE|nr:hypothetical protein RJ639_021848 [Escallonia herrerae]
MSLVLDKKFKVTAVKENIYLKDPSKHEVVGGIIPSPNTGYPNDPPSEKGNLVLLQKEKEHGCHNFGKPRVVPHMVWTKFEKGEFKDLMSVCAIQAKHRPKMMVKVALLSVQYGPALRPLMNIVVKMLEGEQEDSQDKRPQIEEEARKQSKKNEP